MLSPIGLPESNRRWAYVFLGDSPLPNTNNTRNDALQLALPRVLPTGSVTTLLSTVAESVPDPSEIPIMKHYSAKYIITSFSVFFLLGCESQAIKNALPASVAILSGAACYKLFEGKNQKMATAICAVGGLWLGEKLKAHLNQQEQAQLAEATYTTLDNRRPQNIRTANGTTIRTEYIRPTRATPQPAPTPSAQPTRPQPQAQPQTQPQTQPARTPTPPKADTTVAAANDCGTVKQTIITKNNERFEDTVSACKKDGVWVAA